MRQVKSKSILLGTQEWMERNLDVVCFRNGDSLLHAQTAEDWISANERGEPAWCYLNNDPSTCDETGLLYNWFAVTDTRGLAPEGWQIPSDSDWSVLISFLGGTNVAGKKMKSRDGAFYDEASTNESGLSLKISGIRYSEGNFGGGGGVSLWSSSERDAASAWYRYLIFSNDYVGRAGFNKGAGFCV
ncbi:MAG: fibrobacter succinogenes major paralogous domain-containing protein, partial [Bacteroidales bacterium]|nr:fibrobacter succinogenes major paralogous domain-containing protein [Bacteroidales bacterium]